MHTCTLSEKLINATPPPEKGYVEFRERGLVLRIYPSGGRAWSFEYRSRATGQNARVGVPATTLADARAVAQHFRVMLQLGRDPRIENLEANAQQQKALSAYQAEHRRKLPILKAVRWAKQNGANVSVNSDGSYSLTFKGA
jgi:Arm DNA-binding domain